MLETCLQVGSTQLMSPLSSRRGSRYLGNEEEILCFCGVDSPPLKQTAPLRASASAPSRFRTAIRDQVRQSTLAFGALIRKSRRVSPCETILEASYNIIRGEDGFVLGEAKATATEFTIRFAPPMHNNPPITGTDTARVLRACHYACDPCSEPASTTKFMRFGVRGWHGSETQSVSVVDIERCETAPEVQLSQSRAALLSRDVRDVHDRRICGGPVRTVVRRRSLANWIFLMAGTSASRFSTRRMAIISTFYLKKRTSRSSRSTTFGCRNSSSS